MKKNKILLIVALLLLCSCKNNKVETKTDFLIIEKFTEVEENKLGWCFIFYYFLLEDYGAYKVSRDKYFQYDVGDYYTIISYE